MRRAGFDKIESPETLLGRSRRRDDAHRLFRTRPRCVLMSPTRTSLLHVLVVAGLLLGGCDAFGGNDDTSDDETDPPPTSPAALWDGTYEGVGQEVDFYGDLVDVTDVGPTLTIAFQDSTLEQLRLEWNDGNNFAGLTGAVDTLTADTLVTPFTSVDADTFQTEYRFRLGRDTVAAGDSIRIDGTMEQQYENTEVDSTYVLFRVRRPS